MNLLYDLSEVDIYSFYASFSKLNFPYLFANDGNLQVVAFQVGMRFSNKERLKEAIETCLILACKQYQRCQKLGCVRFGFILYKM